MSLRARSLALVAVMLASPIVATASAHDATPHAMRRIHGGTFEPLYRAAGRAPVRVHDFALDARPVTNADYLAFVRRTPRWQRAAVPRLFADEGYLARWQSDLDPGPNARADQPVTGVSWFAASAYCASRHARLPTEAEWEYAARASETAADASRDPAFVATILQWYARPQPDVLPAVASGRPNVWGVYDLHGLVWEWVSDFDAPRAIADSRRANDNGPSRFCGAANIDATTVRDYAAFMRYAFRASLRGAFTVRNLGFRCAADVE